MQTYARARRGFPTEIADYVVRTAPDDRASASPLTFVTSDKQRFDDAMRVEAQRLSVDVAWHFVQRHDGSVYRELEYLEESHDESDRSR